MLILRVLVWKARVRKSQLRSASVRRKFYSDDRLGTLGTCCSGNPCDFHEPIALQPQKSSIVWVALAFEMRLPKERPVYRGRHQHRSWGREPVVHLFCPRSKQDTSAPEWIREAAMEVAASNSRKIRIFCLMELRR